MSTNLPALRLTGATVLVDGALQADDLTLAEGQICPKEAHPTAQEVDLSDYLVLPGIVDLHGDAFERHIAPRPSAPFPLETGLRATDRDAAANGVTTAWIAQSWSWEGGVRGPDYAEDLLAAVDAYRPHMLTDLRVQIRCETHTIGTAERLIAAIKRHGVDYVIFNNHLDQAFVVSEKDPSEFALWAKKAGRTPEDHLANVREAAEQSRQVPGHLCALAEAFDALGVRYGSHDDEDAETRERFHMIGALICEFPTAHAPAAVAKAQGHPVLMGAPNVMRGGSQSGNISATALIAKDRCDALVSDYYYPALAGAAFRLVDDGMMDLAAAWALISKNPARILGLADRGTLAPGQRADLVVMDPKTRTIEATISAGRVAHLTSRAAIRLNQAGASLSLAAE